MHFNQRFNKCIKIIILTLLCNEMEKNFVSNFEDTKPYYRNVVSGPLASQNNAQHHVSIRLKERDREFGKGHICSGVLIAPSVVLTAGHCIYNHKKKQSYHSSELIVVMGTLNRYHSTEQTLIYGVTHYYQSSTSHVQNLHNNLVIIMLERDVPTTTETVKMISWENFDNLSKNRNTKNLKVTAFLHNEEGLPLNQLMFLNASITSLSRLDCLKYICVDLSNIHLQDYGAPLIIDNQLIGIMSYSLDKYSTFMFIDITQYTDWIRQNIGDGHHRNSSAWGILGLIALTIFTIKQSKRLQYENK
uniref:Peptidase S1 domain-containing protein n=1 Tax=Glossina brevipalpis TaxID=37001 RepID=A0A1A9X5G1_9MUSC